MNLSKTNYEEVVIVTTLIKRRNITFLSIENPLESFVSRVDVSHIVLRIYHVTESLQCVTILLSVLFESLDSLVFTYILRELIVSLRVSILRESDFSLDDSSDILSSHRLAVAHLNDDVATISGDILELAHACIVENVKIILGVLIE